MKYLYAIIIFFLMFIHGTASAQDGAIQVMGKVVESTNQQPIEFATVILADKGSNQPISGTTTEEDGTFQLEASHTNFYIEIRFLGFNPIKIDQFNIENGIVQLETIQLGSDQAMLDEVMVTAERSSTEFKLDKRVFNVGQDLSNSGASAIEVLNNVPSVNVNIEGQISLRGSQGVQILINGKPSVLSSDGANALGTITADLIERVEVITNPSAKYDAEGTSGIINIVLKKDEKKGLNGAITLNTGFPNNHSLGFSLNKRTEKFNVFSQLGIGHRTFPNQNSRITRDLVNDVELSRTGTSEKNETFYNVVLGTDYHITKSDVLTLSGRFAFEQERELSDNIFELSSDGQLERWNRTESTRAVNPKWQYDLQYKKDFKDHEDRDLLFSALGSFFGKNQSSDFQDETEIGLRNNGFQQTSTDFKEAQYTFKLDYTHPLAAHFMLESGLQYVSNDVTNDYQVLNLIEEALVIDPNFTNFFEFQQGVVGLYSTLAYELDKWGIKGGLRYENTHFRTVLRNTGAENSDNYFNFFPSFHSSYNVSKNFSVQAGYSKRIYRPRLWDLNPFFNIRDNFNISTGNPNLQPEFTDSYELTAIWKAEKLTMNVGVYQRNTIDVIEDITSFDDNVSLSMPFNVGESRTTGLEYNMKYVPLDWLSVMTDFNLNAFRRTGSFEENTFDFGDERWSGRLTSKIKLPAKIDIELAGHYNSKFQTVQGERRPNYFANVGVRKKIMKGKIILNLSVRDVFATRRWETVTDQSDFYLYSFGQRGRFVVFGVSYGFGKGEAMEFSGHKRF